MNRRRFLTAVAALVPASLAAKLLPVPVPVAKPRPVITMAMFDKAIREAWAPPGPWLPISNVMPIRDFRARRPMKFGGESRQPMVTAGPGRASRKDC